MSYHWGGKQSRAYKTIRWFNSFSSCGPGLALMQMCWRFSSFSSVLHIQRFFFRWRFATMVVRFCSFFFFGPFLLSTCSHSILREIRVPLGQPKTHSHWLQTFVINSLLLDLLAIYDSPAFYLFIFVGEPKPETALKKFDWRK